LGLPGPNLALDDACEGFDLATCQPEGGLIASVLPNSATTSGASRRIAGNRVAICICLALVVFLAFSPVLENGFTGYDDPDYVTQNPHVTTGLTLQNIAWAFSGAHASNWHPLTWLSHQLDCTLFGVNPAASHMVNLLLHMTNTVLLFLWLSGSAGFPYRSAFVALAFGIHPLHVESVAWIAERKDVFSTLFWMLTLLAYTWYTRKPGVGRYLAVTVFFSAGLLSKPMLVSLPVLLLLLDWWPLARTEKWSRLVWEKIPLAALAALSAAATIWAQRQGGSLIALDRIPLELRVANAIVSYVRYIGKTSWPVNLAAFYPFPQVIPMWAVAGSAAVLILVTWFVLGARERQPWLAAGWGWYLLTLLPVIGLVQVGLQSMADRYMYVPLIGLLIAVAWEAASVPRIQVVGVAVLAIWAALSWRQAHVWKDGMTLFTHAVEVTDDNFVAHDNLGVELDRFGRSDEALAQYRETLRIKPGDRNGEQNLAQASFAKGQRLLEQGNLEGALAAFQEGLRYRPQNALAQMSFGVTLARLGRAAAAKKALEDSVSADPSNADAHYDLGLVQQALGDHRGALESYDAALHLRPGFGPAEAARAEALYNLRRYQEAWEAMQAAQAMNVALDPGLAANIRVNAGK
jgi:protein O-mannosyl-transferase